MKDFTPGEGRMDQAFRLVVQFESNYDALEDE